MNIIEYLDAKNIKWFPINILLTPKKKPERVEKYEDGLEWVDTWKPSDEEICDMKKHLEECNAIAIDTSIVHQLDVDLMTHHISSLKLFFPYYESFCKKYPHAFYLSKKKPDLPIQNYQPLIGVEALTGRWAFSNKNAVVFNHEINIKELP